MNRLQTEWQRLYGSPSTTAHLIGPGGEVRAMVLELAHPANWELLAPVWRGVQQVLGWPAPAIAVSGHDGFQLWFSLAEPVTAEQAHAALAALQRQFLPDVASHRLRLMPSATGATPTAPQHAKTVPAPCAEGQWSAFVAPDLAPVFADTPWLDIEPGEQGQADLLRGIQSISPANWAAAQAQWAQAPAAPIDPFTIAAQPGATDALADNAPQAATRFLLQVMQDDTVALALRIEAAKALLPRGR